MDDWVLWLILAVVFAVGEIATLGFFLAPFAAGAAVAAVVSAAGAGLVLSLAIFLVIAAGLLVALRPLARSYRKTPPQIRTGTAALVGRDATVVERIANHEGAGCVKIDGEVWTARSYIDDEVYEAGTRVQVVEIRGATALVTE
jgi:membrane protein implicated in regulation of membrane protease activity